MIAWAIAMPCKLLSVSIGRLVPITREESQGCTLTLYDLGRRLARPFLQLIVCHCVAPRRDRGIHQTNPGRGTPPIEPFDSWGAAGVGRLSTGRE
jgi:hypothetical protein